MCVCVIVKIYEEHLFCSWYKTQMMMSHKLFLPNYVFSLITNGMNDSTLIMSDV